MANSKYEYVKTFESPDYLLPSTFIVVRVDGRGFHRLSKSYNFARPNDKRGLNLMNAAAEAVMQNVPDIEFAYGVSDEFSFVFLRDTRLFDRRESKLTSTIVSTFTAYYIIGWPRFFPDIPLSSPIPTFDARAVVYPRLDILRDYLTWRQVDCHINNLYNTTFWALVQQGSLSNAEAEQKLKGTLAKDKNEILFTEFGINYNNEPDIFKKGSVLYRKPKDNTVASDVKEFEAITKRKEKKGNEFGSWQIVTDHIDIIKDVFWKERPWLLRS